MSYRVHICSFSDPGIYRMQVGAKLWYFEWSDRFGPLVVTKHGREVKNQPMTDGHPFLQAVSYWYRQGKHVGDDGLCAWDKPPPLVLQRINRRNAVIVSGDLDDIDPKNVVYLPPSNSSAS